VRDGPRLPDGQRIGTAPLGVLLRPLQAFLQLEAASGILLLACAAAALVWANVHDASYRAVFDHPLAIGLGGAIHTFSPRALINDGLMTLFFFVVGMEIKRELAVGELSSLAQASLPAVAAAGGMIVPACLYLAFNWGGPGRVGWGIPMATDIAFCVGILTLLRDRVPRSLVVFVTALAIFDDIGSILVIAFFYGDGPQLTWLLGAAALSLVLVAMGRQHVRSGAAYALVGCGLWYTLHHGGVHATIAGVILGLCIPARARRNPREVLEELDTQVHSLVGKPADEELEGVEIDRLERQLEQMQAPLNRFVHLLHPVAAFGVMPLFALANTGVSLRGLGVASLATPVALGVGLGLFVGKQVGIFGITLLSVRLGLARIPGRESLKKLFGVSVLAGVGFTVSLFISALAYADAPLLLDQAKLGVLVGSLLAGVAGYAILRASATVAPPKAGDGAEPR